MSRLLGGYSINSGVRNVIETGYTMSKPCIYKITDIINEKVYIGNAMDFLKRKGMHLYQLNNNKHHSKYLQNAWNKYGGDKFIFEIIEYVEDPSLLLRREQFYLNEILFADKNDTKFDERGYNISRNPTNWLGNRHSEETKKILSLKNKGRKFSEEAKEKMKRNHSRLSGKDHPSYGSKRTKEMSDRQSHTFKKNYKKENHPFYNKKISGAHLEKLKKASSGSNNPMYDNSILNIWIEKYGEEIANKKWEECNKSRSVNGIGKGTKKVIQRDKNYNIINEYKSITEASTQTDININSIGRVCRGERNLAGGFIWEYKNKE